jgi:hypothetical protein
MKEAFEARNDACPIGSKALPRTKAPGEQNDTLRQLEARFFQSETTLGEERKTRAWKQETRSR